MLLSFHVLLGKMRDRSLRHSAKSICETSDYLLQDPFRGGNDELFDQIVSILHAGDEEALAKDSMAPPKPRLVPEILIRLARMVSPF